MLPLFKVHVPVTPETHVWLSAIAAPGLAVRLLVESARTNTRRFLDLPRWQPTAGAQTVGSYEVCCWSLAAMLADAGPSSPWVITAVHLVVPADVAIRHVDIDAALLVGAVRVRHQRLYLGLWSYRD